MLTHDTIGEISKFIENDQFRLINSSFSFFIRKNLGSKPLLNIERGFFRSKSNKKIEIFYEKIKFKLTNFKRRKFIQKNYININSSRYRFKELIIDSKFNDFDLISNFFNQNPSLFKNASIFWKNNKNNYFQNFSNFKTLFEKISKLANNFVFEITTHISWNNIDFNLIMDYLNSDFQKFANNLIFIKIKNEASLPNLIKTMEQVSNLLRDLQVSPILQSFIRL